MRWVKNNNQQCEMDFVELEVSTLNHLPIAIYNPTSVGLREPNTYLPLSGFEQQAAATTTRQYPLQCPSALVAFFRQLHHHPLPSPLSLWVRVQFCEVSFCDW
jgi:hypothetical protein